MENVLTVKQWKNQPFQRHSKITDIKVTLFMTSKRQNFVIYFSFFCLFVGFWGFIFSLTLLVVRLDFPLYVGFFYSQNLETARSDIFIEAFRCNTQIRKYSVLLLLSVQRYALFQVLILILQGLYHP